MATTQRLRDVFTKPRRWRPRQCWRRCAITRGAHSTRCSLKRSPTSSGSTPSERVPFSDPIADGPIIQSSSQRALENGMTYDGALALIEEARLTVPVVLFSYLNPILAAGEDALTRAADAGASGILVTDIPVGADPVREEWLGDSPLAFIRLVAPTTPVDRMAEIARHGSGFVYLISRLGVTGVQDTTDATLPDTIERLKSATRLPICVGFGISTPKQARSVGKLADGVVVGSALVRAAADGPDAVLKLTRSLREGLDA